MNASGIALADELRRAWADLAPTVRFVVLAIRNESIVLDTTADIHGDLDADLPILQDILQDSVPAYVLARLDDPDTNFLAITYVPDSAAVRDKMLFASTRNTLTKSLGAAAFTDTLFATSKADLTPTAYAAHRRHATAPQPLSAREQELALAHAAERTSSIATASSARQSPLGGAGVQLRWDDNVERAVAALANADTSTLIVLGIDTSSEALILTSDAPCAPNDVGSTLPPSEPSYAFFAWPQPSRRYTLFIYSCPSTSAIKHRMVFSSGVAAMLIAATAALGAPVAKKIETSDPPEIDEAFLRDSLGIANNNVRTDEKRPFAKPRGPMRKQR